MTDQTEPIDRMRNDFRVVVADRKACGHWNEADEVEVGKLVKAAIDGRASDVGLLECWADWLSREAEEVRQWKARVRAIEARIHAAAEQERKAA